MQITFVLPNLTLSGGVRVLATYAERLQRRGHKVVVVSTSAPPPALRRRMKNLLLGRFKRRFEYTYLDGLPIDDRRLPHDGPVTDVDVPDADVVVATWWATAPAVYGLSPSKGKKAYFVQGYEAAFEHQPIDLVDATWRLPIPKICVAEWLVDLARERFDDDTAACVPNSVDLQLFHAAPRSKQEPCTVGFVHHALRAKGSDIAIEALVKARERVPNLKVVAFGAEEPSVRGVARHGRRAPTTNPLPSFVEFILRPPQETVRDIYARCDAFLQPSRTEGFGLPILEAMACRTPVIATPAGAAPMLLRGGGGMLVPGEDPGAMADAIVEIATMNDASWTRMSDAAHRTATSYSWDEATAAFERALARIVDERAADTLSATG